MYRKSELLEIITSKYNIHENKKISFNEIKEISKKNRNKRLIIYIRNKI